MVVLQRELYYKTENVKVSFNPRAKYVRNVTLTRTSRLRSIFPCTFRERYSGTKVINDSAEDESKRVKSGRKLGWELLNGRREDANDASRTMHGPESMRRMRKIVWRVSATPAPG